MPLTPSDMLMLIWGVAALLVTGFLISVVSDGECREDSDYAEQCEPLPHAFVDGACGCVEVMDE
jgi:hypothetical protein